MKQYGCLQAMYMSFYSRDLYRDVKKNWGAGVLLYLLLLLTICWVAMMFRIQPTLNQSVVQFIDVVVPQLPHFIRIEKGVLITPENRPYLIKNPETKEVIMIIDTSNKYKSLEEARSHVLITQDKIMYADNDTVKIKKIPTNYEIHIDSAKTKESTLKFVGWFWVILLPVFLLGSFLYRLVQSLIYAVLGKLIAVLLGIRIVYADILKLTIVALTPAIVLSTIAAWLGRGAYHHIWFYFILSMAYIIFAIGANKNTE